MPNYSKAKPAKHVRTAGELPAEIRPLEELDLGRGLHSIVRKKSDACRVADVSLEHSYGPGKAVVQAGLRLTTAVAGERRERGLREKAFLLRLEVARVSPGIRLGDFCLGPWKAEKLNLEAGGLWLPEAVWSAFEPCAGNLPGRAVLLDSLRRKRLDLPWDVEGIFPGFMPLG